MKSSRQFLLHLVETQNEPSRARTSSEYLRAARHMGSLDWKRHPARFTHNGRPHVSDMFAMRHFVESRQVATLTVDALPQADSGVEASAAAPCGLVAAFTIFQGAIKCRSAPPRACEAAADRGRLPGPSSLARSGPVASSARREGSEPLAAHFSHHAVEVIAKGAAAAAAAAGGAGGYAWMPRSLLGSLDAALEPAGTKRGGLSAARAQLIAVAGDAFRKKCLSSR